LHVVSSHRAGDRNGTGALLQLFSDNFPHGCYIARCRAMHSTG
jgi:hypothetical protein